MAKHLNKWSLVEKCINFRWRKPVKTLVKVKGCFFKILMKAIVAGFQRFSYPPLLYLADSSEGLVIRRVEVHQVGLHVGQLVDDHVRFVRLDRRLLGGQRLEDVGNGVADIHLAHFRPRLLETRHHLHTFRTS